MTIIELFAGVGGFRIGLEGDKRNRKYYSPLGDYQSELQHAQFFKTGYANQFEPSKKKQIAADIYEEYFKDGVMDNTDISDVSANKILQSIENLHLGNREIILVGGFPCQDYSVANGLHTSKGLLGKKGVLWWEIYRLLKELKKLNRQPAILLLENVDRLIVSPAKQRGRDFAIMLYTLNSLGYTVEYKIINAAEFDLPQKRKRVFILAYLNKTPLNHKKRYHNNIHETFKPETSDKLESLDLSLYKNKGLQSSLQQLEENFRFKTSPFGNAGICRNFKAYPFKEKTSISASCRTLGSVVSNGTVPSEFYVSNQDLEKWRFHKGSKKILRYKPNGDMYYFAEGKMHLYDSLDKPSRTIITSEGGKSASRTKHLIKTSKGARRLIPQELEKLNMFPENITNHQGVLNSERAFLMGNALVVGVVEMFRDLIIDKYQSENDNQLIQKRK